MGVNLSNLLSFSWTLEPVNIKPVITVKNLILANHFTYELITMKNLVLAKPSFYELLTSLKWCECACKLPVPGRPTYLDNSRARAYSACRRCAWLLF